MNKELKFQKTEEAGEEIVFLKKLEILEPREKLFYGIMASINKKIIFKARLKLAVAAVSASALTAYIAYSWSIMAGQIVGSETGKILSLFFSDWQILLANWKSYVFYLAETLPLAPVLLCLSGLLMFLITIKLLIKTQELPYKNYMAAHK